MVDSGSVRTRPPLAALPAIAFLLAFFAVPLTLLVRVSLYQGGSRSGFGIGGGGFYKPGTWTLDAYGGLIRDAYFRDVLGFTVELGVIVALVCVALAYPTALAISSLGPRSKRFALALVILPKLSNLLVVIYGLKFILSASGPVNETLHTLGLADEPWALSGNRFAVVLGKVYLVIPYTILVLVAALDRIDPELVRAARGLGASPGRAFLTVTLPLSRGGLGAAATISFIWGLGAFVSPYLLGSPQEITLAVDVQKQSFENLSWPRGAAEAVLTLALLAACVAAMRALSLRARGANP